MDAVTADRTDLQRRLAHRQREKAELERRLHAVQTRYEDEIAPLKEKVLRLQVEQLRRAAQRHMRSARHRNAYHDAQRAYETFQEERPNHSEESSPRVLKRRYREASKRCHPDVVPEAYRAQAAATFQALKSAYQDGHTRAVQAIAAALRRWGFPEAHGARSRTARPAETDDLRRAVRSLETAIETLRETDLYQALAGADDVEALLRARKRELLEELRDLTRRSSAAGSRPPWPQ